MELFGNVDHPRNCPVSLTKKTFFEYFMRPYNSNTSPSGYSYQDQQPTPSTANSTNQSSSVSAWEITTPASYLDPALQNRSASDRAQFARLYRVNKAGGAITRLTKNQERHATRISRDVVNWLMQFANEQEAKDNRGTIGKGNLLPLTDRKDILTSILKHVDYLASQGKDVSLQGMADMEEKDLDLGHLKGGDRSRVKRLFNTRND